MAVGRLGMVVTDHQQGRRCINNETNIQRVMRGNRKRRMKGVNNEAHFHALVDQQRENEE